MMSDEQIKALTDEQIMQLTIGELEWLKQNKKHLLSGGQLMTCWFAESTLTRNGKTGEISSVVAEDNPKRQPRKRHGKNVIMSYGHFERPMDYTEKMLDSLH